MGNKTIYGDGVSNNLFISSIFVTLDLGTVFTCLPTHMRMKVDLAKNPDLEPEEMHLNDPSCDPTEFNDTFVLFEIPLDGCGTTRDGSNPDYLLFSNTAHWDPPGSPITYTKAFRAQITCRYSRVAIVNMWFVLPTAPKGKF